MKGRNSVDFYLIFPTHRYLGSSTACVVTLNHLNGLMTVANVGDSGYILFRNGKIIRKSEPQRLTFDCPRQLDSYPWKEESIRAGISYTDIM